jgi:hypothetical protein
MSLLLDNEKRMAYNAPTVMAVNPSIGPLKGGQQVSIEGFSFGNNKIDVSEVLIAGVRCKNLQVLNTGNIQCVTGDASIIGETMGNVVIKKADGKFSPLNTCNMYKYSNIQSSVYSITSPHYINPTIHTEDGPELGSLPTYNTVSNTAMFSPPNLFYSPANNKGLDVLPSYDRFSFKQIIDNANQSINNTKHNNYKSNFDPYAKMRMKQVFNQVPPGLGEIRESLNRKMYGYQYPIRGSNIYEDNLVDDKIRHLRSELNNNGFGFVKQDGLRKNRFARIFNNLNNNQ